MPSVSPKSVTLRATSGWRRRVELCAAQRRRKAAEQLVRQLDAPVVVDHRLRPPPPLGGADRHPRQLLPRGRTDAPLSRARRPPPARGRRRATRSAAAPSATAFLSAAVCPGAPTTRRVERLPQRADGLGTAGGREAVHGRIVDRPQRTADTRRCSTMWQNSGTARSSRIDPSARRDGLARLSCPAPAPFAAPRRPRRADVHHRPDGFALDVRFGVVDELAPVGPSASLPPNSRSRWIAVRRTAGFGDVLQLFDGIPCRFAEADEDVGQPAERAPALLGGQRLGQRPDVAAPSA